MKALLIKVDFRTGRRAGGINPKDPKLPCHGWQNTETGWEIRLVEDNRDLSMYDEVPGVKVLGDKEAINQAIIEIMPTIYSIESEAIMLEHMKEKKISLDTIKGKHMNEIAEELYKKDIAGISKREPELVD